MMTLPRYQAPNVNGETIELSYERGKRAIQTFQIKPNVQIDRVKHSTPSRLGLA